LPAWLWSLLHRPLDLQPLAAAAAGQAGRRALPAARRRDALPPVRPARAPHGVCLAASQRRDVRDVSGRGLAVAGPPGGRYLPRRSQTV